MAAVQRGGKQEKEAEGEVGRQRRAREEGEGRRKKRKKRKFQGLSHRERINLTLHPLMKLYK